MERRRIATTWEQLTATYKERGIVLALQKSLRHFAILKRSGPPHINRSIEQSLRPLGTQVVWIDEYDEIPVRLAEMYQAAGDDWGLVY